MSDAQTNPNGEEIDVTKLPPQKSRRFAGKRSARSVGILGLTVLIMLTLSAFYLKDLPLVWRYAHHVAMRYSVLTPLARLLERLEDVRARDGYTF